MFTAFAIGFVLLAITGLASDPGTNAPNWTPNGHGWQWNGVDRWQRGTPGNPEQWIKNGNNWEYRRSW